MITVPDGPPRPHYPRAELVVLRRARMYPRLAPLRAIEFGRPPNISAPAPVTR